MAITAVREFGFIIASGIALQHSIASTVPTEFLRADDYAIVPVTAARTPSTPMSRPTLRTLLAPSTVNVTMRAVSMPCWTHNARITATKLSAEDGACVNGAEPSSEKSMSLRSFGRLTTLRTESC
jgi:hypothetical protein